MANATVSRLGQVNASGAADALFLKVWAGEVLTSFEQHHLGGSSGYAFSRVQFDCAALTRNQANEVGFAVADVLDGFSGHVGEGSLVRVDDCVLDNKYNRRDQPPKGSTAWRYVRVLDFEISHTQPTPTLLP